MAIPALKVTLDTAQSRIKRDRIATLISAKDWGQRFISNAYIDPITNTAMLCPAPRLPNWSTTGTGIYTRFKKSDYTLTGSKWAEANHLFNGDTYLTSVDPSGNPGEAVKTSANMPRNGGMYLQWYAANGSSDDWVQMECGWSSTPSNPTSSPISLRFYASGNVEVWENGVYQAEYKLSGNGEVPQQTASTFTDVCIIPFRKRELLVFSNRGGGFSHVIESIADTDDDPTIIPGLPFWWSVPQGYVYVQAAKIQYPTSGYVTGVKSWLQNPPQSGEVVQTFVYGDANGGSAVATLVDSENPGSAFVQNGSNTECRVKVALTGNGTISPNIYGAHAFYKPLTANTNGTQTVELLDYITKATLEVPDSPNNITFTCELKKPQEVNDLGGIDRLLREVCNRPITVKIGSQKILDGQTEAPKFHKRFDDTLDRLTLECRDRWKTFEHYAFTDPLPLDGINLTEAFRLILNTAGIDNSFLDLDTIAFDLPSVQSPKEGEFSVLVEVGDTAAEWITRLKDSYYATLFIGWVPRADGIKFVVKKPESLPQSVLVTLYDNIQDAKDYLTSQGADTKLFPRYRITGYQEHYLEPEANDIWVTGRDIRTSRPIQCHKADTNSQDPTLAPDSRPENWLGEIRKYGYYEPAITTQAALEQATSTLFDRLTKARKIVEFDCDMLFKPDNSPIWRGDLVYINGYGNFRITSLSVDFKREPNAENDWYSRHTKYTAEYEPSLTSHTVYIPAPTP